MSPNKHITSGIALGIYIAIRDITLAGASALSAFMRDIDHLLEFACYRYGARLYITSDFRYNR